MDPDPNQPNQHAPSVSADDDWSDQEGIGPQGALLPPIRPDRGIPAKKSPAPRVSVHAPKLKAGHEPFRPSNGSQTESDQDSVVPRNPVSANRSLRSKASKSIGKTNRVPADAEPLAAPLPEPDKEHPDKAVLPAAQPARRIRVKEISLPAEEPPLRPPVLEPKGEPRPPEPAAKEQPSKPSDRRRRFSRGERNEWGERAAGGSLRWMIKTGLAVIALVVAAVMFNRAFNREDERVKQSIYSSLTPEEEASKAGAGDAEMLAKLSREQEDAFAIFAAYATAASPADFTGMLYRAEENASRVSEKWQPMGISAGWKPDAKAVWSVSEWDGRRVGILEGVFPNFDPYRAYFRLADGDVKLDWKATYGYGTASFEALKSGVGDGNEIRAFISLANFHTFPLPEGEFTSFRLVSPDGQQYVWGYAKVGGMIDTELASLFAPSQITGEAQNEVAVVVRLERGPDQALGSQWMITKLIRPNWLDE